CVSKYFAVSWQAPQQVFSHATVVFASDSDAVFAILASSVHEAWVRKNASSLETRLRYGPRDCFETFPFPITLSTELEDLGKRYSELRTTIMESEKIGLTKFYNRVHDQNDVAPRIGAFRSLQIELDTETLRCYGWND